MSASRQQAETGASQRRQRHDKERRGAPRDEKDESGCGNREIDRTTHGACPDRVIERSAEQTDDRGVCPQHGGASARIGAERAPEGQGADEAKHAWNEDGEKRNGGARDPVRRYACDRAQKGGESEKRPRQGLRGPVSGKENPVGNPTGGRDRIAFLLEQANYNIVAVLHHYGALPCRMAEYRTGTGACAGDALNVLALPQRSSAGYVGYQSG